MKVYTYGAYKIVTDKNIVTESNTPSFAVGNKIDATMLRKCGWKVEKSAIIYYSHGGTNSTRFTK
jgi:hypothetical protein